MATSSIAVNKARVLAAKGEQAPPGSLIDADGNPTTDPGALFTDPPGALLPFGGHKGYALGLVAELLAGVLSGGGTIQPEHPRIGVAPNNMFALLRDPQVDFNTDWRTMEVGAFIDYLHACKPQPGVESVQYPGEYEARNRAVNADSVEFDSRIWDGLKKLAADLGVPEALPGGREVRSDGCGFLRHPSRRRPAVRGSTIAVRSLRSGLPRRHLRCCLRQLPSDSLGLIDAPRPAGHQPAVL
ncbi:hypothetical protein G6F68_014209 [Rhizopus microsporus]|nr:hypothetical protein G6F68_014209 [Rhizopus microsporus]